MIDRPYTPERLAERWDCSPDLVRKLLAEGALQGFRLGGKLWRITPQAVEAYECQQTTALEDSAAHGSPFGGRTDEDIAGALKQRMRLMRERRLGSSPANVTDLRDHRRE